MKKTSLLFLKVKRTIINHFSFPFFALCPGLHVFFVLPFVTLNLAALPFATVLGQSSYVQCHIVTMDISDPHIHHSWLHGSDQGLGLLTVQTDPDIQPLTLEAVHEADQVTAPDITPDLHTPGDAADQWS